MTYIWELPKYFWPFHVALLISKEETVEKHLWGIFSSGNLCNAQLAPMFTKEWTWIKLPKNTFNYELHLLSETELFLQFDDNGDDDDGGMMMMMIIQMFVHCILQFSGFILQTSRRFRSHSREAAPRPLRSHPESWTQNKWGNGLKIPLQGKGGDVHHICDKVVKIPPIVIICGHDGFERSFQE